MTPEEIEALLLRREEAVRELEDAKSEIIRVAQNVASTVYMPIEFRRTHVENLRDEARRLELAIDKFAAVIRATDPVFDEVHQKIG